MIKRDFTKSGWAYIKKNWIVLLSVFVVLVVALIVGCVFKLNKNFELEGYNEFNVQISSEKTSKISSYSKEIEKIVNAHGGKFDIVSTLGQGDNTILVVRYLNNLSDAQETEINQDVAAKIEIDVVKISEHTHVNPIVTNKDYIFTAVAIMLLVVIATIFAYVRYNGASAITTLFASLFGTLGLIACTTILRLSVGLNYFAMLVALNLIIIYSAFGIFENIRENSFLVENNYQEAIENAMKKSKFRLCFLSIAIMVIGVMFVLVAPATLKLTSLNIMFMSVVCLAVSSYVVPFVWSLFITYSRKHKLTKKD